MDLFTILTLVWLILSLWLGYSKGFWKSFAALASLLGAYWLSIVAAQPLATWLADSMGFDNIQPFLLWGAAAAAIFFISGFSLRLIISLFSKTLPKMPVTVDRWGAAVLGGLNGMLFAVGVIWSAAFLKEAYALKSGVNDPEDVWGGATPSVVRWSRSLMAWAVSWSYDQSDQSDIAASLSEAFMKSPSELVHDLNHSLRSSEFNALVNNEQLRQRVREKDISAVVQSDDFKEFLALPQVNRLAKNISPDGVVDETEIAENVVDVWHQIDQLQHQQEFKELMSDDEVRNFLNGHGKVTSSLLEKAQKMLTLVAQQKVE